MLTPALEPSVVCMSVACSHDRRRYLCGHVDCVFAHEQEICLACAVPRRLS
jgi:hypothetical protein